ncbi:head maturation protease, ClpP-related [Prauserella muralis]|uniref:ATP-dependent Clp protease proteolytic subunit n=1 Tax=Prauserella muralis TaxID=588067 RepID=A0A2V4B097_9PSEU|nr:head maturation protease, ClpP-related [Prauserella muralis]PXY27427.1 hypothetical protein BAY60_13410 [Prauserella muralis]TWE22873.1 ATP-dependent Clp endopeptidase proteolytic subunit ClpP [Prauserella muralis]
MDLDPKITARVEAFLKARDSKPRPKAQQRPGRRFEYLNVTDGTPELVIYDEIWFLGVSAQDVADQLAGHRGDLHVRINSPGGDVFDGYAIYNLLAEIDGEVTVTVDGLAASAASFIAMAGDKVRMQLASQMMIHEASGFCYGNAQDMTEMADTLNVISDTIAGLYAERTGSDAEGWRTAMRAETWYSPQEAVDAGLADEIVQRQRRRDDDPPEPAAYDLSAFQFAGRVAAPEPDAPPSNPAPQPPASAFDPEKFSNALKEAFK